jgi:hypothetical protein
LTLRYTAVSGETRARRCSHPSGRPTPYPIAGAGRSQTDRSDALGIVTPISCHRREGRSSR